MSEGENPKTAAIREIAEEVGVIIKPDNAKLIFEGIIKGDECMGGANIHKWFLYLAKIETAKIVLDGEGSEYNWFSKTEIPEDITFPVRYLLEQEVVQKSLL